MDTCCIKGCDNPVEALGLCVNHWRRNKLYGSPIALKNHPGMFQGKPAPERFEMRFKKVEGCWLWEGGKDKDGYGIFRGELHGVIHKRAHRFSHALYKGELGKGMSVCHTCDTPSCVNPDHLFLGTTKENQQDKWAKGRAHVLRGVYAPRSILTEEQVRDIMLDPRPFSQIAAQYGVKTSTIGSIKAGDAWSHIEGERIVTPRKGRILEQPRHAKITKDSVIEIRQSSEPKEILAQRYSISVQTVKDILKNRTWKQLLN